MSIWRANVRKEWLIHRSLLIDYALVALVLITILPGDSRTGFAILSCFLAASLGARIGGDEVMFDSWEFILTRPVDRAAWVRMRFLLGLIPLGMTLVFFLLADLLETHQLVARLVADPIGPMPADPFHPLAYALPAAVVLLIYSFSFSFAARERRPENVLNHRVSGFVFGLIAAVVTQVVCQYVGNLASSHGGQSVSIDTGHVEIAGALPLLLGMSVLAFLSSRRRLLRREVTGAGHVVAEQTSGAAAAVAIIFFILFLILLVMMLWNAAAVPSSPVSK